MRKNPKYSRSIFTSGLRCLPHCKLCMYRLRVCVCSTGSDALKQAVWKCVHMFISCVTWQSWCILVSELHYTHTNDSCKDAFHCHAARHGRGGAMSLCRTLIEWEGESVWLQFPYHLNEPWPPPRERERWEQADKPRSSMMELC